MQNCRSAQRVIHTHLDTRTARQFEAWIDGRSVTTWALGGNPPGIRGRAAAVCDAQPHKGSGMASV